MVKIISSSPSSSTMKYDRDPEDKIGEDNLIVYETKELDTAVSGDSCYCVDQRKYLLLLIISR